MSLRGCFFTYSSKAAYLIKKFKSCSPINYTWTSSLLVVIRYPSMHQKPMVVSSCSWGSIAHASSRSKESLTLLFFVCSPLMTISKTSRTTNLMLWMVPKSIMHHIVHGTAVTVVFIALSFLLSFSTVSSPEVKISSIKRTTALVPALPGIWYSSSLHIA